MEPGRYVVAECGVLLTRVTQVKHKVRRVSIWNIQGANGRKNSRPMLPLVHRLFVESYKATRSPAALIIAACCPQAGTTFVGVNGGMNSLLRPALYDAFHAVVSLSGDACDVPLDGSEQTVPERW